MLDKPWCLDFFLLGVCAMPLGMPLLKKLKNLNQTLKVKF
jgi:hypothetical protein